MPDMSVKAEAETQSKEGSEVTINSVASYKCTNPRFPRCLIDMRKYPGMVDISNCRDLTKLYLQATASFNRCIDRRTRLHARRVVDNFNCVARGRQGCPSIYARD